MLQNISQSEFGKKIAEFTLAKKPVDKQNKMKQLENVQDWS